MAPLKGDEAMRKTIIAGNWKMNNTRKEAAALTEALVKGVQGKSGLPEIVLCPPFTSLPVVIDAAKGSSISVGAQNMEHRDSGAYTGEVSPLMLLELGVKYVILGHSERRQYFGETNQTVNLKLKAALKHGLLPIVCVGETLDERENNLTDSVVSRQVAAGLADLKEDELNNLVIAYEPVWAIGTGKVCESTEANRVIGLIRTTLAGLHAGSKLGDQTPVLYGGSMNAKNAGELLEQPNIDGGLVGGASLKPEEFLPIIEAGQKRLATAKV
jgi:triosephosphate isomerase